MAEAHGQDASIMNQAVISHLTAVMTQGAVMVAS
jgi:hypothetical protein